MVFLNGVETIAFCCPVVQCVFAGVCRVIFVSSWKLYGPLPHSIPTCSVHGSHISSSVQPGGTVPSTPDPRVTSATGGAESSTKS